MSGDERVQQLEGQLTHCNQTLRELQNQIETLRRGASNREVSLVRDESMVFHLAGRQVGDLRVVVSSAPIRRQDGAVCGCVTTLANQAALFEANIQLREQAAELREAAQRLDQRVRERTEELERSREQTRVYARRLAEEVENERRGIARELHDEAGQSLTAILLGLGMVEQEARRSAPHLVEPLQELKREADQVMEGLHRLSRNLRPASLDRVGLVAALRQHIQSYQQQTGIAVDFAPVHFDNGYDRVPGEVETAVYRVVQEALTNVARHAEAQRVGVVLKRKAQRVLAIVEDDGRGFDVSEALERGRLGLAGMRERAELLGGRLTIESSLGTGTTVFLDIPTEMPVDGAIPGDDED